MVDLRFDQELMRWFYGFEEKLSCLGDGLKVHLSLGVPLKTHPPPPKTKLGLQPFIFFPTDQCERKTNGVG